MSTRAWPWSVRTWAVPQATGMALALGTVAIAAIAPFLQTLHAYFIGDDFGFVHLFSNQPPLHFLTLFWQSWDENLYGNVPDEIRPMVALSYQIDFFLGSGSPEAFHVGNIAFHVVNSWLVLLIGREVARLSLLAAVAGGIFFAALSIHAETVSWISGRADLIPATFYLGSFLAYAIWRSSGRQRLYVISLVLFFLALFSKQYAITMILTLVLFDALIGRSVPRASWRWLGAYAPFLVLTVAYLGLRYILFQNFVREGGMSLGALLRAIPAAQEQNLEVLVFGQLALQDLPGALQAVTRGLALLAIVVGLVPAVLDWRRKGRLQRGSTVWTLAYFGPVWWLISVLPLTVTYLTPRHLYLAGVGVAITVGLAGDVLRRTRRRPWQYAGGIGLVALLIGSSSGLHLGVSEWTRSADISGKMVRDVAMVASAARPGTLLLVDARPHATVTTVRSAATTLKLKPPPGQPWLWSFAMPYVTQPPFVPEDISQRATYVAPLDAYCCTQDAWFAQTRQALLTWRQQMEMPVVALTWNTSTGDLTFASAVDACMLSSVLDAADSAEHLNQSLMALFERLGRAQGGGC